MTVKEWTQTKFTDAGAEIQHTPSHYKSASGLYWSPSKNQLIPLKAIDTEQNWPANFTLPEGFIHTPRNDGYKYFFGRHGTTGNLLTAEYEEDWTLASLNDMGIAAAGSYTLSGQHQNNIATESGGNYYFVTSDKIYWTDGPSAAILEHTFANSIIHLINYGGRLFATDSQGKAYHKNKSGSFTQLFDPGPNISIHHVQPFNQYILLVASYEPDSIAIYRLPDWSPLSLHHIVTIPAASGDYPHINGRTEGKPYATHNGDLYLLSGTLTGKAQSTPYQLFKFDGYNLQQIAQTPTPPLRTNYYTTGLISWREKLIYYQNSELYILEGSQFNHYTTVNNSHATHTAVYPFGEEIVVTSATGFKHSENSNYIASVLETAWLHMNQPGTLKQLHAIRVEFNNPLDNSESTTSTATIKYKLDDETTWTTLTSGTTLTLTSSAIKRQFYRLKIQITAGTNGSTPRLISAVYSTPS